VGLTPGHKAEKKRRPEKKLLQGEKWPNLFTQFTGRKKVDQSLSHDLASKVDAVGEPLWLSG
jgi:hypothetical protein